MTNTSMAAIVPMALPLMLAAQCPVGSVLIDSPAAWSDYATNHGNCDTINGDLDLNLWWSPDLSLFADLDVITGNFTWSGGFVGPIPNAFSGLDELDEVWGSVTVQFLPQLPSMIGLGSLKYIGGDLSLGGVDALVDLSGLADLEHVGGDIELNAGPAFTSIQGLQALDTVMGIFTINTAGGFPLVLGPDLLRYAGGVEILGPYAQQVGGFNGLQVVGGDLSIYNASTLSTISGFDALSVVDGSLSIALLPSLTSLGGFGDLDTIGGDLQLSAIEDLTTLNGPSDLDVVSGFFHVTGNTSLATLNGFAELDSIGGQLLLSGNPQLSDISAFDHPVAIGTLQITSNPGLQLCYVEAVCAELQADGGGVAGNLPSGCGDVPDVLSYCALMTQVESPEGGRVHLYPIPAEDVLYTTWPGGCAVGQAALIDGLGRTVVQPVSTSSGPLQMDLSGVAAGTYVLHAACGDRVFVAPVVKQ